LVPPADGGSDRGRFRPDGEEVRYEGWRISVVEGTFTAPDGERFTRDIVRHPGAVAIVPVTDRDSILLVRQYRGAVDDYLIEIPAGTRDVEGEKPEVTAARELTEEVGVRATHLEHLGSMYNTPGFCDERTELYLATGLQPASPSRHGAEERFISVEEVAFGDVDGLVASGALIDGQTILGIMLARERLARLGDHHR
jgi:8-oxo-dGTP pyrophosphatase MutT (NUDIX family)